MLGGRDNHYTTETTTLRMGEIKIFKIKADLKNDCACARWAALFISSMKSMAVNGSVCWLLLPRKYLFAKWHWETQFVSSFCQGKFSDSWKYFKGIFVNLDHLKPADKFRGKTSLLRGDDGSTTVGLLDLDISNLYLLSRKISMNVLWLVPCKHSLFQFDSQTTSHDAMQQLLVLRG